MKEEKETALLLLAVARACFFSVWPLAPSKEFQICARGRRMSEVTAFASQASDDANLGIAGSRAVTRVLNRSVHPRHTSIEPHIFVQMM